MPRRVEAVPAARPSADDPWASRGRRARIATTPALTLLVVTLLTALLLAACAPDADTPAATGDGSVERDTDGDPAPEPGPAAPSEVDEPTARDESASDDAQDQPTTGRRRLDVPVRAAWVHLFDDTLKSREGIASMVRELEAAQVEVLFAQAIRRHDAYYDSEVLPRTVDPALAHDVDVLDELLAATAETDIAVHVWFSIAPTDHAVYDELVTPTDWLATRHGRDAPLEDRWVTRDDDGAWSDYLDVGLTQVHDHVVGVVTEIVERYPVAGIHLDYARYPSARSGYHPQVVARYQRESGTTSVPAFDDPAFVAWRQQQATALVAAVRSALRALDPELILSAAVITWGDGPGGPATPSFAASRPATEALQDWPSWIEQDLVDLVVPMNYFRAHDADQAAWFERWLAYEAELAARHDALVVAGIGAWLNRSDAVIDQARQAVERVDGAAIYSVQQPSDDDDRTVWARLRTEAWPGGR